MATYFPPKRATEFIFYFGLQPYAGSGIQANPTIASGDVKVSLDGGALTNLTNLPTVTPASGKMVKVILTSSEMTADNVTVVFDDQTDPPEWLDVVINIQTAAASMDDIATNVWSIGTRTLTALDEDTTTLDLDATIRGAVGMASANLDTQLTGINTNIDATEVKVDAILVDTGTDIPAALTIIDNEVGIIDGIVDAILVDTGTTLDGKIDTIDTVLDALVADIGSNGAGLTALPWNSAWDAEIQSEVTDALTVYDVATDDDVPSVAQIADGVWDELLSVHNIVGSAGDTLNEIGAGNATPTADEIGDDIAARTLNVNIVQVNSVPIDGAGSELDPWGPA